MVHLPPTDAFARYTNGVEEYGLSAAVLPGGRQVVVQSAKLGGSFAVWDAVVGGIAVEVEVPASYPIVFTSALSSSGTLGRLRRHPLRVRPGVVGGSVLGPAPTGTYGQLRGLALERRGGRDRSDRLE